MRVKMGNRTKLNLLLVDFDGVLSNGRFYNAVNGEERALSEFAVKHIFAPDNFELLNDWMRGKHTYREVHKFIEKEYGLSAEKLDKLLIASVKRMHINQPLLQYADKLRSNGVKVCLFTNNMDIFDTVSRFAHNLDNHFDHIYSSSEHGRLKLEDDSLLRRACQDAGTQVGDVALVDDSQASFDLAEKYGVATFLYDKYEDSQTAFEAWISERYSVL
jgi:FMN phosphatase YigB (HAD superfamily)